ncbi:MAG TPA: hypothetical protein VGK36_20785 [Candidatus Angelobacter sp.]|jgi:hypothetical protein
MQKHFLVLTLLAYVYIAPSQTIRNSSNNGAPTQESAATSETYSDTLRTIRTWVDSEENDDLARLLRIGEVRASDLVAACHSSEDDIAGAAFLTLQLLGKSECRTCADSVSEMRHGLAMACGANISETDFQRIELWLAKKRTVNGYECGEDYEPLTPMDDSLVYALIIEGSSRSRSVLDNMLAFQKACATGPTILGDILEQAQSLIVAARKVGHNLRVEPERLERTIRASAFFLPQKYRKDSKVEVIVRSKMRDRILLEVSYLCGRLCGSGYYVVLRKDGTDWHYLLIRMAWIS